MDSSNSGLADDFAFGVILVLIAAFFVFAIGAVGYFIGQNHPSHTDNFTAVCKYRGGSVNGTDCIQGNTGIMRMK